MMVGYSLNRLLQNNTSLEGGGGLGIEGLFGFLFVCFVLLLL